VEKPHHIPRLGIDLGGTKIEVAALADATGRPLFRRRVDVPKGDYGASLAAIEALVAQAERDLGRPAALGFGVPGAISPASGLVKNANSTWLIGKDLKGDLEDRFARRVRIANDADCFALAEARRGAAQGYASVFGVILGTGVGGGIVIGGQLVSGPNAIAGEWGHNPLPWPQDDERPGPACYCGRAGCIETWLSGPALAREAGVASGEAAAQAALEGDPRATDARSRYQDRLARSLASVVNILDPHVIVLGGGLSKLPGLCDAVTRLWDAWVFSDRVDTVLRRAVQGDSAGVLGAAELWRLDEAEMGLPA
jgi:fructokinase